MANQFAQFTKAPGQNINTKAAQVRSAGGVHIATGDALKELQDQLESMRTGLAGVFVDDTTSGIQPGTITNVDLAPGFSLYQVVASLPALPNANFPIGAVVFDLATQRLYRNAANVWTDGVPSSSISTPLTVNNFSAAIRPIQVVSSLPPLPDANYPTGSVVLNGLDGQLYRNFGNVWRNEVPAVNITGQITTTQISPNAITTPLLAANAVVASVIAAGAVTAGKLAANSVIAGTIAVGAVNASDITVGTLTVTVKITNAGSSGIITDITQGTDPVAGINFGIQIKQNGGNGRISIGPLGIYVINTSNQVVLTLLNSTGGLITVANSSGITTAGLGNNTFGGTISVGGPGTGSGHLEMVSGGSAQLRLTNTSSANRVITGVDGSDRGYVQLNTPSANNFVPVVASVGQKIAFGAAQLSSGTKSVNTGLSAITSFVATLDTGGGAPTEYLATYGASGGTINVISSNAASSLFFSWAAFGTV